MTPLASVAILEKLALLKIAFCSAPALRSISSDCLLAVTSGPSGSESLPDRMHRSCPRRLLHSWAWARGFAPRALGQDVRPGHFGAVAASNGPLLETLRGRSHRGEGGCRHNCDSV